MMLVHLLIRLRIPLARFRLQLLRLGLDVGLLLLVARYLGLPALLACVVGRGVAGKFGEGLLGALRLEVIPLVGGFGLLDGGVVLVDARVGLRGAAHVREDGAEGGDDGRAHGDLARHAHAAGVLRCGVCVMALAVAVAARCGVFEFVIVRAVHVKAVS